MRVRAHAVVAALGAGVAAALMGAALRVPTRGQPTARRDTGQDTTPRSGSRQTTRPGALTGGYWTKLSSAEKESYLKGFLAGAGADSARALPDRRFRFAPSVYEVQLDDYYWYADHLATPIVEALITINKEMLAQ